MTLFSMSINVRNYHKHTNLEIRI